MSRLLYGEELAADIWHRLHRFPSLAFGSPKIGLTLGQIASLGTESTLLEVCYHDPEIVRDTTWEM